MAKEKTCFVIGPIGEPESEDRIWSDKILECIITPAVEACGYSAPVRADQISQPGMITIQIIQHLIDDDLVIADLSRHNANVYYELAVRHAAKKPIVQLIEQGKQIPFDVKDLRTIEISTDIKVGRAATEQLKTYIHEVEKCGSRVETPISLAVDIQLMRASGDVQQKTLADLLIKVDAVHSAILLLEQRMIAFKPLLLSHDSGASTFLPSYADMINPSYKELAVAQDYYYTALQESLKAMSEQSKKAMQESLKTMLEQYNKTPKPSK